MYDESRTQSVELPRRHVTWSDGRSPRNRVARSAAVPCIRSSTRSTSACSCSTARSARGCRARTSAPTTSAARRSRAATRTSSRPGPTSSPQMHDEFFAVGVDGVETATFGAFPLVLNEYGLADQTFEINRHAAADRPRGRVGSRRRRPAPLRDRLDRARAPGSRRSGRSSTTTLRDDYELQVDGLIAGGIDVLLIETVYDLLQAKAAINGARRGDAPRRAVEPDPDHGAGHGRDDGPHARRHRDRRRAHRARSDAARRHRHELRDRSGRDDRAPPLPRAARAHVPVGAARTRGCRRSSTATRTTTSRPTLLAEAHERFATEFGLNVVGGCCGTTPEHLRRSSSASTGRAPVLRTPEFEPGCSSIYSHVPFEQELAYLADRRAHERQRLAQVPRRDARGRLGHVRADGARTGEGRRARARRVRRLRRPRRRHRHGRDRGPLRHAGVAAARVRLDRAARARSRPPAPRRQGAAQLGQPRRGRGRGQAHGPRVPARARVRRGRHLPHDRRRGPGAHRGVEDARREAHLRHRDRALRPRTAPT